MIEINLSRVHMRMERNENIVAQKKESQTYINNLRYENYKFISTVEYCLRL